MRKVRRLATATSHPQYLRGFLLLPGGSGESAATARALRKVMAWILPAPRRDRVLAAMGNNAAPSPNGCHNHILEHSTSLTNNKKVEDFVYHIFLVFYSASLFPIQRDLVE